MTTILEARQTDNENYLKSSEWKELMEKAKTAINQNYTIIYRDVTGELQEAWHYLSDLDIHLVKEKYKKQKKEIVRLIPRELPFGEYLQQITGDSKEAR